jgi:hypothetical protein
MVGGLVIDALERIMKEVALRNKSLMGPKNITKNVRLGSWSTE